MTSNCSRYFGSISGGASGRADTRGAELLSCFDFGSPSTTLAHHEANSGSTSCFYLAASTNRHPYLEPALSLQRQLKRHLIMVVIWYYNQSGKNEMNRALGHLCAHIG